MRRVSRRQLARAVVRELRDGRQRGPLMKSVAAYLLCYGMVNQAELLVQDIAHELFTETGHLMATMESAEQLSHSLESSLRSYLKRVTKADRVELTKHIDPSLLGGVRLSVPGAELDLTVRRQLKQLRGVNS